MSAHHTTARKAPVIDTDAQLNEPITGPADLLAIFAGAAKPKAEWRVGAEAEKFGVYAKTGQPLRYEGERGVLAILNELAERHGWAPQRETPDGPVISLLRSHASITLEPGGQLELSGAPLETMHQICAEFRGHIAELADISTEFDIKWLGLGFHPFAKRSDLGFVPKYRYGVMREYLPTRGGHALDMMLRTCTVQANFDYDGEADAMRKMRVGLKLSPLTTAMFANSPWYEGAPHGGKTYRGEVWLDVDPDRTGLLPVLWGEKGRFEDYVEWALGAPMFLVKRDKDIMRNTGQTFRSFMKSGYEGYRATFGDWQMHLNTLFPEVRLKKTIEIRGADAQGTPTRCALPALWTGIYYDERALAEADALTADWNHAEVSASREAFARGGVRASFRGKPVVEVAQRVIEIAEGGLERRAFKRSDGKDERVHLARLKELVGKGMTPADVLLEGMERATDFRREVVKRADLSGS